MATFSLTDIKSAAGDTLSTSLAKRAVNTPTPSVPGAPIVPPATDYTLYYVGIGVVAAFLLWKLR